MRKPSFERERESLRERAREIHLVNLLRGVPVKLHMAQSSNSRQQGKGGRQRERNGERKNMQWDSKSDCSLFDKVIESQLKLCHVSLFKGPFTQDVFLPSKTARHVSTAEDIHLRPDYAEKQHLWMQKRELFQVSLLHCPSTEKHSLLPLRHPSMVVWPDNLPLIWAEQWGHNYTKTEY